MINQQALNTMTEAIIAFGKVFSSVRAIVYDMSEHLDAVQSIHRRYKKKRLRKKKLNQYLRGL